MALYIKVNKSVAEFLHLTGDRYRTNDGNYLLWQADMLHFGNLTDLPVILRQIGGIALRAHEAKLEQDGVTLRTLPDAEDDRFKEQPEETASVEVEDENENEEGGGQ